MEIGDQGPASASKANLKLKLAYRTKSGSCFQGLAEQFLLSPFADAYRGKVDLIFTSPPFPLNRKKKYGNLQGKEYVRWFSSFASLLRDFLKPSGSIVIEVGNSWIPGKPVMNTLALESLLAFLRKGRFFLCQQFVWHNPARLPSPAQWVTVERIRLKDSFTHLWWMSRSARPKADNRRVLVEYSDSMKRLLISQSYNSGKRPSEHNIGKKSFLKNNRGAIPSNVLTVPLEYPDRNDVPSSVIKLPNTQASTRYLKYCREHKLEPHPARMPIGLPEFFIKFLTDPGDLVLDPFGGSNITGFAAERLGRRWISIEPNTDYVRGSRGHFLQ